jgi:DNA-binding NarL/FixJ family response regulator
MKKTIIAIIEDDEELRSSLHQYLSSLGEYLITFSGASLESYFYHSSHLAEPDIILLDIGLPGISGCEGVRLLKSRLPETDVIMYTVHDENAEIFQSICNGASGYLLKTEPFAEVHKALQTIKNGGSVMSPSIARKVMEALQIDKKRNTKNNKILTAKEQEIVCSLVEGFSYKMIADHMNISIDTVRTHIKNIYKKLHVHSRAELIKRSYYRNL